MKIKLLIFTLICTTLLLSGCTERPVTWHNATVVDKDVTGTASQVWYITTFKLDSGRGVIGHGETIYANTQVGQNVTVSVYNDDGSLKEVGFKT